MDTKTSRDASGGFIRESRAGASIIRVDKRAGRWEAIPRALIEDERLSLEARWFAIWLASRSPDWEIRAGRLPFLLKDATRRNGCVGRDATKRMLRELQRCGYLVRSRTRTSIGRWSWQSVFRSVSELPTIDGFTVDGSSVDGRTVDGEGVDLLHTDQFRLNQYTINTTTTETDPVYERSTDVVVSNDMRFPTCLAGETLASARAVMAGCASEQRQAVLDEIEAMHAASRVRSPIGLLHRLVERANQGRFVPNLSAHRSALRPAVEAKARPLKSGLKAHAKGLVSASDIAQRALANLRQKLE